MDADFIKMLQTKIQSYVDRQSTSLVTLAREAQVPLPIVKGFLEGRFVNYKFFHIYAVLRLVDPANCEDLLLRHFTNYLNTFSRMTPREVDRQEAALSIAVSRRIYYKIHSMASAFHGTTRSKVIACLGESGEKALDELLQQNVLEERDGKVIDPFHNFHQSSESLLRKMIKYNLDEFYPDDPYSIIMNSVEGLSEHGLNNVKQLSRQFHNDLLLVVKDPQSQGTETFFVSFAMGKLFPDKLAQVGRTSFESFDAAAEENLSALAHDMKVPMKHVLGFLEKYNKKDMSPAEIMQARSAAFRVDLMIESLKKLNGHEIVFRKIDTLSLDSVIQFAEATAQEFGKEFRFLGQREFSGFIDIEKVYRLLQNLLMNAFEAARSTVEFEYAREGSDICFLIKDDGPGVRDEHQDKIFERGFTFGKTDGTGLGLATVKLIARSHEGDVFYLREGGKTIFKVVFGNVFSNAVYEEKLGRILKEEAGSHADDKPILMINLPKADTFEETLEVLANELPFYSVTDDMAALHIARLVCTSNLDVASQAVDAGVSRVWTVPASMATHSDFLPALVRLAKKELEDRESNFERDAR